MSSEPMPTAHKIDRRRFLQGVVGAVVAGVGLSGRAPGSPVGSAEAIPPLVVGGVAAGSVAVGWALRETEVVGSNPPPEGSTGDTLQNNAFSAAKKRRSNNQSTFIDNRNILDGIQHTAYTEAKVKAIEKLNNGAAEAEVLDSAKTASNSHFTTIEKNLIKSWNESATEMASYWTAFESHPDLYRTQLLAFDEDLYTDSTQNGYTWSEGTEAVTLSDGTTFDANTLEYHDDLNQNLTLRWSLLDPLYQASPIPGDDIPVNEPVFRFDYDTNSQFVLYANEWEGLLSEIQTLSSDVETGIETWVNGVYGDVQSGDIDVEDLLTPREQAELLSDDEEYPQAVADLIALNLPVDPDREATISFTERDITISGLMAPTSQPENGFVSGETYDPSAEPWDLYFTYDPSRGAGGWSEVEPDIPEGQLTFTDEPYEGVLYRISTTTGDTVEVTAADFTESESGGMWTADVSEQVSPTVTEWTDYETGIDGGEVTFTSLPAESATFVITANDGGEETVSDTDLTDNGDGTYSVDTSLGIAEISEVEATIERTEVDPEETTDMFSEDGSAEYETVQISEPFTIDRIEDSDGNEVQESEFSQSEPQDDTNYITQEEWDELEEQNQELIDRYEEATETNDGLFGGGGFGDIDIGDIGGSAAVVGAVVVVGAYGVLRTAIKFYIPGK